MSGPKTSAYELEQRRLRREREKIKSEINSLLSNVETFKQIWENLVIPVPPTGKDIEELKKFRTKLQQQVLSLKERGKKELADSSLKAIFASAGADNVEVRKTESPAVQDARELVFAIGTARTQEDEAVVTMLADVAMGHRILDDSLRGMANAILERYDQDDAGGIAREVLQEMGYTLEGEFSTLFVEGGMVHFQKDGWGDYFVRMRVNPDEQFLNFNVVRAGEPDSTRERATRDQEMEKNWCGEYTALLQHLRDSGIACGPLRATEPGVISVQTVPPETLGKTTSTPITRTALKTMERRL